MRDSNFLISSYRALDLTDDKSMFCGKLLAHLGADVIKIERPGGDPSRKIGPFYQDIPDPEKSLFWFAYNAGKRGITLNIEVAEGQEIFKRLVQGADVLIESFAPGYMAQIGLNYSELSKINPGLIMTSITPFGQDGPYKDYKGPDIVVMAMGGLMYQCGDQDRPPVRISFPQAYINAGADAAIGTLIALYYRGISGEGQSVDVSAQERVVWTSHMAAQWWDLLKVKSKRCGAGVYRERGAIQRDIWPCKDGYIAYAIIGGVTGARSNRALVEWMEEEGKAPQFLESMDWLNLDYGSISQEDYDHIGEPIEAFFKAHTKLEIYEQARKRRIMLLPVATTEDIIRNPHLKSRGFWQEISHPELNSSIKYPGDFVKLSEASLRPVSRPPLIGEHNEEIYGKELGFSRKKLETLKTQGII